MGIAAILDKAGPSLASGIILALLGAAATSAMAWRDLSSSSAVRFEYVVTELGKVRAELDSFRAPGGRFTAADGARHDERLRQLEQFAKLCGEAKVKLDTELGHMKEQQEQLCSRLQGCARPR